MSSYPRNSSFIDLRSRIKTPVLKTRQILNELESMKRAPETSVSSPIRVPGYPSPRSLTSSIFDSRSPAPRSLTSSSLRPSLLESKSQEPRSLRPSLLLPESSRRSSLLPGTSSQVDRRPTPVLKTVNKRKIEPGYKPNIFSVEDESPQAKKQMQELETVQALLNKEIVKNCLLNTTSEDLDEFKFDAPEVRGPRKRSAEEPLSTDAPAAKISKPSIVITPSKPKWECPTCMVRNEDEKTECPCCQTPKPGAAAPKPSEAAPKPKWECPTCMVRNENERTECPCCQTPKPGAAGTNAAKAPEAPKSVFKATTFQVPADASSLFGVPKPANGSTAPAANEPFKFGATPSSDLPKPAETNGPKAPAEPFKFGVTSSATAIPSFGLPKSTDATGAAVTTNEPFKFGTTSSSDLSKPAETNGQKVPVAGESAISGSVPSFGLPKSDATGAAPAVNEPFKFGSTPTAAPMFGGIKPADTNGAKIPAETPASVPIFGGIKPADTNGQKAATTNEPFKFGSTPLSDLSKPAETKAPVAAEPFKFGATSTTTAPPLFNLPKSVDANEPKAPTTAEPFKFGSTQPAATVPIFGGIKPADTNGAKIPALSEPFKFGSTPAAAPIFGGIQPTEINGQKAPATNEPFKFGSTPAPAPMFGTQPVNAAPVAFNFGGNTSLGNNSFSFTAANNAAPATNNTAAPFVFGSAAPTGNTPAPAAPSFVPLNSGIPAFSAPAPVGNPFSTSNTAGGAMGRRKLTAKRKTRI